MKMMDLFAGIGGFRYPLERLGIECVWSCEVDKYARQVYRYHWNEEIAGDVREVDTGTIPDFDLLCAGFPCQAFSIAGKRQGFQDTRGTLFFEICRILRDKRPEMVLLENVKGLLSHDNYRTFRIILESLRDLGYMGQYQVLNSKNFGVPQNRERVFIVGYLGEGSRPEIFPIGKNNRISERENGTEQGSPQANICGTVKPKNRADDTFVVHNIYGGFEEKEPRVFVNISPTIRTPKGGGHLPMIINLQRRSENIPSIQMARAEGKPDPCGSGILTRIDGTTYPVECSNLMGTIQNKSIRRLTPLECERLQGFPDNWTKQGIDEDGNEIRISDTQRYKMMGNAVSIPVITAIGERLK